MTSMTYLPSNEVDSITMLLPKESSFFNKEKGLAVRHC